MIRSGCWLCLALVACPLAGEDFPLRTESARTASAGALVFEGGVSAERLQENFQTGLERDVWAGPLLRLVYSPADSVELGVDWVAAVGQIDDPTYGSGSDFGDVNLNVKWRVRQEHGGAPALGLRFEATLPQTSYGEGLGTNTLRMRVEGLLTKAVSPRFDITGNLGLALIDEPLRPHEQRDLVAFGLAFVGRVGSELDLVTEVSGRVGDGEPGADQSVQARLGARFGKRKWRGSAALTHGFMDAEGHWGFTAGATWTIRAGR